MLLTLKFDICIFSISKNSVILRQKRKLAGELCQVSRFISKHVFLVLKTNPFQSLTSFPNILTSELELEVKKLKRAAAAGKIAMFHSGVTQYREQK